MEIKSYMLAFFALLFVVACQSADRPADTQRVDNETAAVPAVEEQDTGSGQEAEAASGEVKTFVFTGENFAFYMDGQENPDIRVNQGDRVRIEFASTEGFHDWVVDEFGAATEKVRAPNSTSVEFVADQAGTFEYYCSVGEHREMGMRGNLIVE